MLAIAWPWDEASQGPVSKLSQRLVSSLCAGIGGDAVAQDIDGIHFAYRPLGATNKITSHWGPARLPSGAIVTFHGYFDNAAAIASELNESETDLARLYGLAVERWGDQAECRVIGEYCAVIIGSNTKHLRLSRSPLRAPPLYYFHDAQLAAVASVPRALFAVGVPQRLNEVRVADSALINFSDREACWFEDIKRVPVGAVVDIHRGRTRAIRMPYDLFAVPKVRLANDKEYIERAAALLDEAVRVCMRGFSKPASTLSSGLDSPQVAVRALAALPPGEKLPTFTFHPEAGYDGIEEPRSLGDERPFVEAFAALHPGIEPHFTANEGYEHDYRWNDFFHLMGGAPSGLCNMYVFHGLFRGAAKEGRDVLLLAEFGNYTFSDNGHWGFVEYFLKGKWHQLWLALSRLPLDERPVWARFLVRTILPFLPNPVWRFLRRIAKRKENGLIDMMQPLSRDYRERSGAQARLDASGVFLERYQPRNHRQALQQVFRNGGGEAAAIYQAFEQMYGVAQRDPTAYRPFVEFCAGLPTEMFLRDGRRRWLAKELAKGVMPEDQRANIRNGRWDSDWHLRIGRRRKDFLAEIDRLEADERIAAILDLPRLRAALEDWPEHTVIDPQQVYGREFAVPRGLLVARFIKYVEGRNDG